MNQRIIKFRAFNTVDKTMGEPFTLQTAIGSRLHNGVKTDDVLYLQFTGLLDKNGKEIFEGDVVRNGPVGHSLIKAWVVEFSEESLAYNLNRTLVFEIIGNIYENPDLIK